MGSNDCYIPFLWRGVTERCVLPHLHVPFWIGFGRGDELFANVLAWNGMVFELEFCGGHLHLQLVVLLMMLKYRSILNDK